MPEQTTYDRSKRQFTFLFDTDDASGIYKVKMLFNAKEQKQFAGSFFGI